MNAPVPAGSFRPARLPDVGLDGLRHLPGDPKPGLTVVNTIKLLADPLGTAARNYARYGPVYRNNNFNGWSVTLVGPEANELVMFDREKNFSSELGWNPILGRLFPRGLMLMDFDHHRMDRKTLSVAFKPEPMRNYIGALNDGVARGVAGWPEEIKFYSAIKQLTLDLAAHSFLGIPWGPEAERINQAFVAMVAASIGIVRVPLPFTAMGRGVAGRKYMCEFFGREIPKRRGAVGDDMFTQICNAENDQGKLLSDDEIIDHMNFLMMAAHDTITSSLTSLVYYLAKNPEWQDELRKEVLAVKAEAGDALPYDRLGDLQFCEMAFKEALRLTSPVPSMPRRALRDFEFMGYRIPAGTHVGVTPMATHRLADIWPEPERFDPLRFTTQNSKGRHKYAWVPFGGGAHMCLGLHFAYMQVKVFLYHLLSTRRIVLADGYEGDFSMFPIPKPKDGLPVRLERL